MGPYWALLRLNYREPVSALLGALQGIFASEPGRIRAQSEFKIAQIFNNGQSIK